MEYDKAVRLLKKRPGYEAVYKLRQSDQRREDLGQYVGTDGGTLQRWINEAEDAGLISVEKILSDEEIHTVISLAQSIPDQLVSIVEDRGGKGPRDSVKGFADVAGPSNTHHWDDNHSL